MTPREAQIKIREILKAHALYHTLSEELLARSLVLFAQELDPTRCYLTNTELAPWIHPQNETLRKYLAEILQEKFSVFDDIFALMQQAIVRRRSIETSLETTQPEPHDPSSAIPQEWPATEAELKKRLQQIKYLQAVTAAKLLSTDEQERLQLRIEKQRLAREDLLLTQDVTQRNHLCLTYVIKAIASSLDSHTAYFTPAETQQLLIHVQQKLLGIGAQLRDDLNGLTITRILESSPLSRQDLVQIGDKIVAIDGTPVIGLDIQQAVELIRGPKGTSVQLTLLRGDVTFETSVCREEVILQENRFTSYLEPFGSGGIAVLNLHTFYQDDQSSSSQDIIDALTRLAHKRSLQGVILDLRNNTGGVLPQAVAVAGIFMNKGIVVSIKDHTGWIQHLRNLESSPIWPGPLMILVNPLSASASEIVAQTLQEYQRALILGETTFGKGSFQTLSLDSRNDHTINPLGEYKVTRGLYYTPSGKTPQKEGVTPDVVIPSVLSHELIGERHTPHPIPPDHIPPCFDDDLSDLPLFQRYQVSRLYQQGKQFKDPMYTPLLARLKHNASYRLEHSHPASTSDATSDHQLKEALALMKDLIMLANKK